MKATTYLKNIHRIIPVAFRQYIENSFVDKQRLFIYIYATVGSVLILDINLLGVSGPYGSYFYVANMCHLLSILFIYLGFIKKRMSLKTSLVLLMFICQAFTLAEMIYAAHHITYYHVALIIGDMILLGAIIFFCIIGYLSRYVWPLVFTTFLTYIYCCVLSGNVILSNVVFPFIIIFLLVGLMAKPLSYHLAIVTKENENLQSCRYRLLSLLHVNKKDIRKYIQLAHTQGVPGETDG